MGEILVAIYHLHAQIIGRKDGRSAVAAAAYRSGEALYDEENKKTFHWTRDDVTHTEILAPEDAPDSMYDRQFLWNFAQKMEGRRDSQLAREMDIALPRELNPAQRLKLVRQYVVDMFVSDNMIADISIHDDGKNHNPHAHVMLALRQVTAWGFKRVKTRAWNSKNALNYWREQWSVYANLALQKAGHKTTIDHRTLKSQGVKRQPTIHEGVAAREMAAKRFKPFRSGVRSVNGWQRKGRSVVYKLIDQGRSRVAYNRQCELTSVKGSALHTLAYPDFQHYKREPWREAGALVAQAKQKLALVKRKQTRLNFMIRHARQELHAYERRMRFLPRVVRQRLRRRLSDRRAKIQKMTYKAGEINYIVLMAEGQLQNTLYSLKELRNKEANRRYVNNQAKKTYVQDIRRLAMDDERYIWQSHLPLSVKRGIAQDVQMIKPKQPQLFTPQLERSRKLS